MKACLSCAATPAEAPFPARGRTCIECTAWQAREAPQRSSKIQTRASYRAHLRVRQKSPQADLVDMLVGSP